MEFRMKAKEGARDGDFDATFKPRPAAVIPVTPLNTQFV
jgi:hypothetical protein